MASEQVIVADSASGFSKGYPSKAGHIKIMGVATADEIGSLKSVAGRRVEFNVSISDLISGLRHALSSRTEVLDGDLVEEAAQLLAKAARPISRFDPYHGGIRAAILRTAEILAQDE